jgi:hypothetical protein
LFHRSLDTRRWTPSLTEYVLDTVFKNVPGSQTTGNVQPLLPSLMFSPLSLVELLQPTVVLQRIIFVVEVEVDACAIEHSSRDLAPSALPVI